MGGRLLRRREYGTDSADSDGPRSGYRRRYRLLAYGIMPVLLTMLLGAAGGTAVVAWHASGNSSSASATARAIAAFNKSQAMAAIRKDARTARSGVARLDAQNTCTSSEGGAIETCLQTTGTGLVVGNMIGELVNDSLSTIGYTCVEIIGPSFQIQSSCDELPALTGIEVGWDQESTPSLGGYYCAQGLSDNNGSITPLGTEDCIYVNS
jgi:hypothetical protein